jgi:hypothetical protein
LAICFLFLVTLATIGCASRSTVRRPAIINHVVFISLHDNADVDELIADCDAMLTTIPGVASYGAGTHLDTGRSAVDGNYDVGLFIGFNSRDDYAVYVDHPNHIALVTKWKPGIKQMRIFDINDDEG